MDGRDDKGCEVRLQRPAAVARDPDRSADEGGRRRRPEQDQRRGRDQRELGLDPGQTRADLGPARDARAVGAWSGGSGRHLKCLTTFVTKTRSRSIPAASSARSRTWPAGPTNGRPAWSSRSPGCSPTSISVAGTGPSPNTVWVARSQSGHERHSAAERRRSSSPAPAATLLGAAAARSCGSATALVAVAVARRVIARVLRLGTG